MVPTMVLVADDSCDAHRNRALHGLAAAVEGRQEAPVVSVFGPAPEVNDTVRIIEGPLAVVPAFVAGGDIASAAMFAQLDLEGRVDVCATPPLGAVPSIVADLACRLYASGWTRGDGVVLAADGANDQDERQVVTDVVRMLSRRLRSRVQVGFLNGWAPTVPDAVARLREGQSSRVSVATWRLVAGSDLERLHELGADSVTSPLWPAELIVDTLLAQHRAANARLSA